MMMETGEDKRRCLSKPLNPRPLNPFSLLPVYPYWGASLTGDDG